MTDSCAGGGNAKHEALEESEVYGIDSMGSVPYWTDLYLTITLIRLRGNICCVSCPIAHFGC